MGARVKKERRRAAARARDRVFPLDGGFSYRCSAENLYRSRMSKAVTDEDRAAAVAGRLEGEEARIVVPRFEGVNCRCITVFEEDR